jgi:nucleotide-binding universal stress UspA family protein
VIDLRHILAPTDFSPPSDHALKYAAALAEKFGAELVLLHVVQDLGTFYPDPAMAAPAIGGGLDQLTAAVHAGFDRAIEEHHLQRLAPRREVREGAAAAEIVRFAAEAKTDLIVMGTHGRTGLAHVVLGSVTEKVIREAPCPVLAVRRPTHEFVHP